MSHHRGLECEPSEDIFWRLIVAASVSSCFIGIFYLTNSKSGSFGGVFHGTLDCRNSRKSFQKVLVIVMPGPVLDTTWIGAIGTSGLRVSISENTS